MRLLVPLSLLLAWAAISPTNGFTTTTMIQQPLQLPDRMVTSSSKLPAETMMDKRCNNNFASNTALFSSAPSDSASDEPDFSAFGYGGGTSSSSSSSALEETVATEALVNKVLESLPSDLFGDTPVNSSTQATINEIMYTLEALNPTKSPALSPLVNGVWELRYSGGYTDEFALASPTRQLALFLYSGGYSPGLFLYRLAQTLPQQVLSCSDKPLTITIRRDQPRVEASMSLKLLNGVVDSQVSVQARLEAVSSRRLRETYESVTVLGRTAPTALPAPFRYARDLYVTYVDDDLLVVRDASGVPEILVRQEKRFQRNWGVEPSAKTDMGPPGDGEDAKF